MVGRVTPGRAPDYGPLAPPPPEVFVNPQRIFQTAGFSCVATCLRHSRHMLAAVSSGQRLFEYLDQAPSSRLALQDGMKSVLLDDEFEEAAADPRRILHPQPANISSAHRRVLLSHAQLKEKPRRRADEFAAQLRVIGWLLRSLRNSRLAWLMRVQPLPLHYVRLLRRDDFDWLEPLLPPERRIAEEGGSAHSSRRPASHGYDGTGQPAVHIARLSVPDDHRRPSSPAGDHSRRPSPSAGYRPHSTTKAGHGLQFSVPKEHGGRSSHSDEQSRRRSSARGHGAHLGVPVHRRRQASLSRSGRKRCPSSAGARRQPSARSARRHQRSDPDGPRGSEPSQGSLLSWTELVAGTEGGEQAAGRRAPLLPPWQTVERQEERHKRLLRLQRHSGSELAGRLLDQVRRVLADTRQRLTHVYDHRVQHMDADRRQRLQHKYLSVQTAICESTALRRMRDEVAARAAAARPAVIPARWYKLLERRAAELELPDSAMAELEPFMTDELSVFSSGAARLCLLVMSLPVYELLTLRWQRAIMFVLVEILQRHEGLLHGWLQMRGYPDLIEQEE